MTKSVSHKNEQGMNLAFREYWRDDRDRILAWKRGIGGPNGMENGRGDRYVYDPEGQLTDAIYQALDPETDNPREVRRGDTFQYDALGNRWGSNHVANRGPVNFNRRNNGLNQYSDWTGSAVYYDDNFGSPPQPSPSPPWIPPGNGVMMAQGYFTASYNALNQPMAVWTPEYPTQFVWFGYDPLGRCVKRWIGSGTENDPASNLAAYYYYDGWSLIQEGNSANNPARMYVHGGRLDEIVASQAGSVWNYHNYDARGHCIMLTDTSGGIREQYDYDAFGFPYFYNGSGDKLLPSQQSGNRFLFTGREWLRDLRLYDFRNRMYQPELGRFLQPDPQEFAAGDYNLYRYCHNDPINHTDPTGLDLRIDSYDPQEYAALQAVIDRVAQTPEGATAIQAMRISPFDNVVQSTLPGFGNETRPADPANQDNKNVGSAARMSIQLTSETRTRTDGTKETGPASVKAGHEIGHGASMNKGEQAREDPTAKGANYIKQPSESKSDSIKVENAVRKLENLKPRD
jgi:RHS repeat-associated protein